MPGYPRRGTAVPQNARVVLFILLALGWAACSEDHGSGGTELADPAACVPGEAYEHYILPFTLEYRYSGTLTLSITCDETQGVLTMNQNMGFLLKDIPYNGRGIRYTIAETGDLLYTLKILIQEPASSICAGLPVAGSLSLSAKRGSDYLVGALTAYCGETALSGKPDRLMRLSGRLEHHELGANGS
jgi:hypothetical protein